MRGAPERGSTRVGSGHTPNYSVLERLAREESSSTFGGATTLRITTLSITTLSIMTLSIMTLSIMTLSIMTSKIMLSVVYVECHLC